MKRRDFLKGVAGAMTAQASSNLVIKPAWARSLPAESAILSPATLESAILDALPGKVPLIKRTFRPPNYETPLSYFNQLFTPNKAFFVRYHLSNIPRVDLNEWKLRIDGDAVSRSLELTIPELKKNFKQFEIVAVNQCAGNRRGLFQPQAPGIQWGHGAMGNARWRGVRLRDVLDTAGVKKNAVEVIAGGTDSGLTVRLPDFMKSLPLWKAFDENTLIAFDMNGAPLPHWNGYPARLVVPGWTATYWMKHLDSIQVTAKPFTGFWMSTAYRIPNGAFPPGPFESQTSDANTPVTEIVINSLITNIENGQRFNTGQNIRVNGIAWDGGHGIERVEVSLDGGNSWQPAQLKEDYGRFSWRQWHFQFQSRNQGKLSIMARATNRTGATQPMELTQNPAGYHHNKIQKLDVEIV
ncbi:MAG: molybdopterin-dependent oxidoreductase [Gammaproteobacteria bacterium]